MKWMYRPMRPPPQNDPKGSPVSTTRKIAYKAGTAKGAATKTAGRLTGNWRLQARGRRAQARGRRAQAQGKLRQAAAKIRDAFRR